MMMHGQAGRTTRRAFLGGCAGFGGLAALGGCAGLRADRCAPSAPPNYWCTWATQGATLADNLKAGKIRPGDACVLRFLGLKGRFGTTAFTFQEMLKGRDELFRSCAVVTDGRFSGGSSGLSVGYVSPEAALMGPLGLVRDGDEIAIDIPQRTISVAADLDARKKDFAWTFDGSKYPRFLNLFVRNVGSMAHGGIWE